MSGEEKKKFFKLCEVCPEIKIIDDIGLKNVTLEEYKQAEFWIESVLKKLNPKWSDIQKVAFIDNAIGKKVSYSPDIDTEVFDKGDSRTIWKIINSGYGICNGIAQLEKYMLSKVGIDVKMVSSENHSFLILENIKLPTSNGEYVIGDTILDPTWNMAAHRYGAKPELFCRSYEEIRSYDITDDGNDSESHKNDRVLGTRTTIGLDEKSLRQIFTSIGIANKNGEFPIKELIDMSTILGSFKFSEEKSIEKQLLLLAKYCPEFSTCQNSTSTILQVILNNQNFKYNKCVVNRVYNKENPNKESVLYVYVDLPESEKKFYFADKDTRQFVKLDQKEFEKRFECYKEDLKEYNGLRPWQTEERNSKKDLSKSSGKVVLREGIDI